MACPSSGEDAVKMLRYCAELAILENRIIIFIEPIALYMTRDLHEPNDQKWLGVYPPLEEK